MKIAYKNLKNRRHRVAACTEIKPGVTRAKEVSFIMVAKGLIGFRESAQIVKIAEETGCAIAIASGKKYGTNKSILSLINLTITPGKSLVLNIKGERNEEAFREISKIIGTDQS